MDGKCKLEIVDGLRDFFLKCFWISFFLVIVVSLISVFSFDWQQQFLSSMYDLESDDFSKIYVEMFAVWKILVIQFTLIPALVLWLIENKMKKSINK